MVIDKTYICLKPYQHYKTDDFDADQFIFM